ncbi:hypothetical protein [Amycolatopsis taiwanensis]|uniref:hypothetical protein n=1 Tax=Amycolatopsis taiwanensis TaxID=342230 RepID=UPI00048585A4|nr:hypothetical protein [Amycolatopsis taiwanensis]
MTTPRKGTAKTTATTDDSTPDTATAGDSKPASADTVDTSPASAEESTVTLATPPFTSEFRVGQHAITTAGTKVPASEAEKVRTAALRSGIALREIQ